MKKIVFASVLALAGLGLMVAPTLRAQDQITFKDPAEYNAYQMAITQTDPTAKAAALESFLKNYPQTVVKNAVLDMLMGTYQQLHDPDKTLSAASRLLQVDPNNMKAIYISVYLKKAACTKSVNPKTGKSSDTETCDDAATLATKGLAVPKPTGVSGDDWKKQTAVTYPIFHSTIALDDAVSKQDYKSAIQEYRASLMLLTDEESKTAGLVDTLSLADLYTKPVTRDLEKAVWFYARVWDYAPPAYKAQIEPKLEYYYKQYHGGLDGLNAIKQKAEATTFPPGDFAITKAKTPAEQIHDLLATTPDLTTLALADKETVLAMGAKDDADKMWAVLQNKPTPVPGTVIGSAVTALKVKVLAGRTVHEERATDYTVSLTTPTTCEDLQKNEGTELKAQEDYITKNGVADDLAKLTPLFADTGHVRKITIEGMANQIKVAVTQDAKSSNTPDFIVNLKAPTSCADIPATGSDFGIQPAAELDGTYDTYKQIPATATTVQRAEIVLRDGVVLQPVKKKPVAHHAVERRRSRSRSR
ncbi:MAG TPA: hypothetical protein VND90_13485 [Terracidiphilus sp.]|nr:hypothetical protein [Terracidiphilus sp.]